jgi:hypothetical protein
MTVNKLERAILSTFKILRSLPTYPKEWIFSKNLKSGNATPRSASIYHRS